jgi:hypothetical protein
MGDPAAAAHDGGVHAVLRQAREDSLGWNTLSDFRLLVSFYRAPPLLSFPVLVPGMVRSRSRRAHNIIGCFPKSVTTTLISPSSMAMVRCSEQVLTMRSFVARNPM